MNKTLACVLLISLLGISTVSAVIGVDVSDYIDTDTFSCLIDNYGIQFSIARGYMSYGAVDYNAVYTNENG
jgi:hypothetical protein